MHKCLQGRAELGTAPKDQKCSREILVTPGNEVLQAVQGREESGVVEDEARYRGMGRG